MKTWLYLTAEGLIAPSADWPCCVWSSTGQRQLMPLNQAAHTLNGQAIDLLLPTELCSWVRSEPWPGKRHPGQQAIAFAVEEQLGEALEALHLSVGARDAQGRYPVLVIGRERFSAVLALLTGVGIAVRSVFVDADLLPPDQAQGVCWFGRWLLGGALPTRLAVANDGLSVLEPLLPEGMQWHDERQDVAAVDQWLMIDHGYAINLRQGEFAPRRKHLPWRFAGLTIVILLLLTWGASETRIHYLDSETHRLYAQNEQRFKTLYPEQSRIVDLTAQLKALQNQSAQLQDTHIAGLVRLIEQVIGASHVEVRRIEFRQGDGWKVQLTANSFAELEQLRERGRQQGLPVRLDSASKERERVLATLTLEADS